jgi:toxin-antitoxin system PIN domain toxin
MVALLDVNVLTALLDASHMHHAVATQWLSDHLDQGWASCPLTQNGCIRILSQTAYPNRAPAAEVAVRLSEATLHPAHHFWPDAVSLLSPGLMAWSNLLTGRHITDAYLLALAVQNRGRFVTLDQGIPLAAVQHAQTKHLVVLKPLSH